MKSIFNSILEKLTGKKDVSKTLIKKIFGEIPLDDFTAIYAFNLTAYGNNDPIEKKIKEKQKHIKYIIETKFTPETIGGYTNRFPSYHCVIDMENDLVDYVEEIFAPFKKNGFEIICLNQKLGDILNNDTQVYFISWKNAKDVKKS